MASQLDRKIITGLAQDNLSKSMCAFSYVLKISYQLCITSLGLLSVCVFGKQVQHIIV